MKEGCMYGEKIKYYARIRNKAIRTQDGKAFFPDLKTDTFRDPVGTASSG
jgi:hypothetical protein